MASVPQFYVYVLARPNGKPFYVGKGKGHRIWDHDSEARRGHKCHKCNVIRKIWKQGGEIQRYIVFTTDDEQEAFVYEQTMIALHGRENLCNLTDGGDGISGFAHSEETRAKIRAANLGRKPPPISEAGRQKIRETHLGNKRLVGYKASEETRRKMSAAQKVAQNRVEVNEGNTERTRASWADSEIRARRIAGIRRTQAMPEARERMAERMRAVWTDPEKRAKITRALRKRTASDEYREKKREIARTRGHARNFGSYFRPQTYTLIAPDGTKHITNDLKTFCKEHGLVYSSIWCTLSGDPKRRSCHGWTGYRGTN